jgi:uncharacterized membrane protein YbhN (UPF0104 family)
MLGYMLMAESNRGMVGRAPAPQEPPEDRGPDAPEVAEALPDVDQAQAGKRLRNGLISLGFLVALVVGLLLAVPGLHGVGRAVAHMSSGYVLLGVLFEVLSCLGYVVAFLWVFERAPLVFGARVALSQLAFGAAVSAGGATSIAAGGLLMIERGGSVARVAERSAVLFLLTSAVNVLTLGIAGLAAWFGILPGAHNPWLTLVPGAICMSVFFAVLGLPWVSDRLAPPTKTGKVARAIRAVADIIRSTAHYLFSLNWRLIPTFGFLWFDIAVLAVCFAAVGPLPPVAVIVLAYQIGYLSNLLPVPGGIGVLDGSFIGMFALYGVNATSAAAATVVYHAISLWVPLMWGTIAFVNLRRTRSQPLKLRPPRERRRSGG